MANTSINDDSDESEEGKTVGGKKKLIIIVAAVLLLGGGAAGAYFAGLFGDQGKSEAEVTEAAPDAAPVASGDAAKGEVVLDENGKPIGGPTYYELPEFLVNLSSPSGGKTSFLKMKVTLELAGPQSVAVAEANKPRIQDAFNTYLREMRATDLAGSAGIYRLREELLTRVNKSMEPEQVKDILFSEIIVQ